MNTRSYRATLSALFQMLDQANLADSDCSAEWQRSGDEVQKYGEFFGDLWSAIESIAGREILEHWSATNEVDFSLANRKADR